MGNKNNIIDADDFTTDLASKLRHIPGRINDKLNLTNVNQILRETFQDYEANRKTVVPYENLKVISAEAFSNIVSNDLLIRCKTDFYTGPLHARYTRNHIVLGSFLTYDIYIGVSEGLQLNTIILKYGNADEDYYSFNPHFQSVISSRPDKQKVFTEALQRAAFIGYKFLSTI